MKQTILYLSVLLVFACNSPDATFKTLRFQKQFEKEFPVSKDLSFHRLFDDYLILNDQNNIYFYNRSTLKIIKQVPLPLLLCLSLLAE